jgi:CDP-diacylglycerol--serine O-phosphatidyltransferase
MKSHRHHGSLSPADLVTIVNGALGFLAVVFLVRYWARNPAELGNGIQTYEVKLAGLLIGLAAICDVADGIVARFTWSSHLGDHLDGMADAISFGVAPALLIAVAGLQYSSLTSALFLAAATTHVVAVVVRLARHAVAPHSPTDGFVGITSPLAALAVLGAIGIAVPPAATIAALLALSALMLGGFAFPHQSRPGVMVTIVGCFCVAIATAAGLVSLRFAGALSLFVTIAIPITARVGSVFGRPASLPERGTP